MDICIYTWKNGIIRNKTIMKDVLIFARYAIRLMSEVLPVQFICAGMYKTDFNSCIRGVRGWHQSFGPSLLINYSIGCVTLWDLKRQSKTEYHAYLVLSEHLSMILKIVCFSSNTITIFNEKKMCI